MKRLLALAISKVLGRSCTFCGKAVSRVIRYEQNTGSIGYQVKVLHDSGCHCKACGIWFCGECSDKSEGLGSGNFRDGHLCLKCPKCRREAQTPIVITNPSWRG
jgi:phage FluMu protein Com